MGGQQAGQPGHPHDAQGERMGAHQPQLPVLVEKPGAGPVHQAQPGAVEEVDSPQVDHQPDVRVCRHPVEVRGDLHGRGDVDLAAELQHRVPPVLPDTQMPGERRRFLLHCDIPSTLFDTAGLQVTGGGVDDVL